MVRTQHFSPPFSPDGDRTLAALASAAKEFTERSVELESAICEYVARLKAEGLPAEHVVISVKEIIRRSGLGRDPNAANVLVDGVITFCIEQFYKEPSKGGAISS